MRGAMPRFPAALAAALAALTFAPPATPQAVEPVLTLEATLRDFKDDHPDFEAFSNHERKPILGVVQPRLSPDGKPVLDEAHLDEPEDRRMVTSPASFDQWFRNVPGVNIPKRVRLETEYDPRTRLFTFQRDNRRGGGWFPLDGEGWRDDQAPWFLWWQLPSHNYDFTTEIRTAFRYTAPSERPGRPLIFEFHGDDDLWVFINGELVLDLGGVHPQISGSVDIDALAGELGLEPNVFYPLVIFHAERAVYESNFKLQTNLLLLPSVSQSSYD